jgi:hypothetical protein
MSGPKSYRVQVFDNHLKTLFQLQSEVMMLWEALLKQSEKKSDKDEAGQSREFIAENKKAVDQHLRIIRADVQGLVSQQQFDDFYNRIHRKIEKLHQLKKNIKAQLLTLEKHEEAEEIRRKNILDFEKLRTDFEFLRQKVKSEISESDQNKKLNNPKLGLLDRLAFDFKFDKLDTETIHQEKEKIDVAFKQACLSLGEVLSGGQNAQENTEHKLKVHLQAVEDKSETDESVMIQKIELSLSKIQHPETKTNFRNRLQKYQQKSGDAHYYLVELYDDIRFEIVDHKNRSQLENMEKSLKTRAFHPKLKTEIRQTRAQISKALQREKLKDDDVLQVENLMKILEHKNRNLLREDMLAAREREYIKANLLSLLSEMNYEVAQDTQVIDFERENDILLTIPGQENFLNLRFDDEGRMLYNFLIPENKTELSIDEQSVKLSEMEETCKEFKNVLLDLKKQGLDIELQHEIEISEKALIRVPPNHAKVLSGNQKKQKHSKSAPSRQKKKKGL